MSMTLTIPLILLFIFPLMVKNYYPLPKNVIIIFMAQPLLLASMSVVFFVGGLVSVHIAPSPSFSTLPITTMILGVAFNTIPASYFLKKLGRKKGTYLGLTIGLIGSILAMFATHIANFWLFIISTFLIGACVSYVQQLRFAAIESSHHDKDIPGIVSFLMIGGIFSAFIGPETALIAKDWIPSPYGYSGSFLALSLLIISAMVIFIGFENPKIKSVNYSEKPRPIASLMSQKIFIVAVTAGAVGYAVMSFVMTGTPISMHIAHHLSLEDTKLVLQSHIAAMYIPSLFMGFLFNRFGVQKILATGILLYGIMVFIALQGQQVMQYWWAMVFLGAGWNCLFSSGTILLPRSYRPHERFKVQAINDFTIFGCQAIASLSAGWIIFKFSWQTMLYAVIPALLLMGAISIWYSRTPSTTK